MCGATKVAILALKLCDLDYWPAGHPDLYFTQTKILFVQMVPMGVINATFIFDHKFNHRLVTKLSIEGLLQPQEVASSQNIYLAYVPV